MHVERITKTVAQNVVEAKHYSGRLGIFWHGFGLYKGERLVGVCCFGQPSAPIQKHAFKDRDFPIMELTRLVVDDGVPNGASFLISHALDMLPKPAAIISYADTEHGHVGIVYQASNWTYTGATVAHDSLYVVDGERLHPMTLRDRYSVTKPVEWARENGIEVVRPKPKHRYFYFVGSKSARRRMRSHLKYPVVPGYPKGAKGHYNAGPPCAVAALGKVTVPVPRTGQTDMFNYTFGGN